MGKLIVTVPDEMEAALKQISEETSAPVAAIVREAITQWLAQRGIDVDNNVSWGGPRPGSGVGRKDDESQAAAVGVG